MNQITAPTTDNISVTIGAATPEEIRAVAWGLFRIAADFELGEGKAEPILEDPNNDPEGEPYEFEHGSHYVQAAIPVPGCAYDAFVDNCEGFWHVAPEVPRDSITIPDAKLALEANIYAIILAERFTERGI